MLIQHLDDQGVLTLTLNRPAKRNAFNTETRRAIIAGLDEAESDAAVRVVMLKGAGGFFSAGRDLKEPRAEDRQTILQEQEDWTGAFHRLHRLRVPSIAVVEGFAYAGGFTLALGCDFLIAEKSALFGAMEMRNGFPAAVCTPILAHLVGPKLGLEFALFGEPIPAVRLAECGLINRLADDTDELETVSAEFARHIAGLDPQAVSLTRETFRAARAMPFDNALDVGKHLNAFLGATDWYAEGAKRLRSSEE